jgi:hypothetical protein
MLSFDHMRLVRRDVREVARYRRWLLEAAPGDVTQAKVVHRSDYRCCKKERWERTAAVLQGAIKPTTATVAINLVETT